MEIRLKVFVLTLFSIDSSEIIGVYTSEDLAKNKLEEKMDELYEANEDLGVYASIDELYIDDKSEEDYT